MKKTITLFSFIALLAACGSKGENTNGSGAETTATKVKKVDGAKIYKTYCIACHGLYGNMGASGAIDLTTSKLSLKERIEVITKGRNLMTPFEGLLNREKIKAVAKYIETLRTEEQ